mmetsp:Transcript_27342/g.49193  ORF Transcript_27342/g.49193 Transcript_27342/m.49193 type:complete len:140 (-) Transcript_27342:33-452(-)
MTSFSEAERLGIKWPQGPDDLCPSKIENTYLYAGGRTRKLKRIIYAGFATWLGATYALDKYLVANRHLKHQNYLLERTCLWSVRLLIPSAVVTLGLLPLSQLMYWKLIDIAAGMKPLERDPRPKWKPGEGLLAELEHAE